MRGISQMQRYSVEILEGKGAEGNEAGAGCDG